MKLDKIKFARLIGMITSVAKRTLDSDEISAFDHVCDIEVPEQVAQQVYPANANVERLMALMAEGTKKIDAIREHRAITGMGLRESKEAVERYWPDSTPKMTKQQLYDKLKDMRLPSSADECISAFILDCF